MPQNNYYTYTLATLLKEWHDSIGYTNYAMAKVLKLDRKVLDRIEQGQTANSEAVLKYFMHALRVKPSLLYEYEERLDRHKTEQDQLEAMAFQEKERRKKEAEEIARKQKEIEEIRASILEQYTQRTEQELADLNRALATKVEELSSLQQAAAVQAAAHETAVKKLKEVISASEAEKTKLATTNEDLSKQVSQLAQEILSVRSKLEETSRENEQMKNASLWKRILGFRRKK